eukprot:767468-Hanusia_phi.AAC.2
MQGWAGPPVARQTRAVKARQGQARQMFHAMIGAAVWHWRAGRGCKGDLRVTLRTFRVEMWTIWKKRKGYHLYEGWGKEQLENGEPRLKNSRENGKETTVNRSEERTAGAFQECEAERSRGAWVRVSWEWTRQQEGRQERDRAPRGFVLESDDCSCKERYSDDADGMIARRAIDFDIIDEREDLEQTFG